MKTVIPAWDLPTVPVAGTDARFPVRHIYCVGRNYAEHVKEMGGDAAKEPPFFFTKPADAVVTPGRDPAYPPRTRNLHHEIELVVAIGRSGEKLDAARALDVVYGYATGLDMTRRDLQNAAKDKGHPWDAGKAFDDSAPISAIRRGHEPPAGRIRIAVNGAVKQEGRIGDMIWNVAEIVAEASKLWALAPGDLIYTGTPEGVGPLVPGDRVEGEVEGVGRIGFTVAG